MRLPTFYEQNIIPNWGITVLKLIEMLDPWVFCIDACFKVFFNFRLYSKILLKLLIFSSILEKIAIFVENFEYERKDRNG